MPDLPYATSVEGGEVSISDEFGPLSGYYDEYQLSPCANLPLVINAAFLRRHNILPSGFSPSVNRDNFVSTELYSSAEERNQLHTSNWEIRQELFVRDLRYIYDFGPNHRIFNHLQLEDGGMGHFEYYYELPHGERLWSNRVINDSIRDKRDAHGDNFWGENYYWLYENWWFLFSGFKDVNFIISETKGEDCDDLNETTKAYGDWYFDGDRDGYHNADIGPHENTCTPPSDEWILLENSKGPDCNDIDPNETELITWYFDGDLDEYYSTTVAVEQSCENPAKGTGDEAKWRQDPGNGEDCYDEDPEANDENRIWYHDFDGDNYYGSTVNSCRNPAIGTEEESRWKPDPGEGEDCDDNDLDSQTYNACGVCGGSDDPSPQYIDIDGDGYHSVYKFQDCGLNEFPGSLVRAGLPASVVGYGTQDLVLTFPAHLSHLTGITMPYDVATDTYTVPDEIISETTLGLDCDDLISTELSHGEWYPDVDGDGYHENLVSPVIGCSPPNAATYILLSNSNGPDCDDTAPEFHTPKIWYYDSDGDGYYTDSQVSCEPPGEFWNIMSGIGFDDDDDNPFSPALIPPSQTETFAIPSVIDIVGEAPYEQLEYEGNLYDPSQITISYRGVTFTYDDLIFERASAEIRLQPNNLLIPEGHPLMDAVIKISGEPVQTLAVRTESTYTNTGDEQDLRPCNEWTSHIRELYPGYNSVCGDLLIHEVAEAGNYFQELFDPAQFDTLKAHYDNHGHPPFGVKFQSFIEEFDGDFNVVSRPIIDETIGPEDSIGIIITARKTVGGTIEYVVSIRDETFEPTNAELQREGWKDANGDWTGDLTQGEYNRQLSDMQKFRKLMPGVLALDYSTDAALVPPSPSVPSQEGLPDLPPEPYPEYNYGSWGFLTKLVEFYELGHHVSHEFKVPDGIWDPAAEDWDRWRAKTPAGVAGTVDTSIREIRDLAEMVKLAQSLCYKETWEQILEAAKNFNAGEQVRAMISSFDEELETLRGDHGIQKQYYTIAKVAILTVSAIYAGWKAVGRFTSRLRTNIDGPIEGVDQKYFDFTNAFEAQINKSIQFSELPKEFQDALIRDLSSLEIPRNQFDELNIRFAELPSKLASDPDLINSWRRMQQSNAPERFRKDPQILEKTKNFDCN